jgi:dTDP-3-amino-3,4,6-trideoxy-alpha-D-glucose transaminase
VTTEADRQGSHKERPRLVGVQLVSDPRGTIGVIETGAQLDFPFRRFYFLTDFPGGVERGGHAHKELRQVLIALRGSVTVELTDLECDYTFHLSSFDQGLQIPPGCWRVLKNISADALIGVVASDEYEESDYIRDFDEFRAWCSGLQSDSGVAFAPLERYANAAFVGPLSKNVLAAVNETIVSGRYIGGPRVTEFESTFAAYCDASHAVGVANGTEALQLALMADSIGPGDEVIVPAHTFVATALAVVHVGAKPVLVDIDKGTGLLDVSRLEMACSARTRAIIPVHLYGHPVDMDPVVSIAKERGLVVIEDAAQAHGALYRGRKVGSLGDSAAFSFYPTKNLGAMGDAGAVTTGSRNRAKKIQMLSNYGSERRYYHEMLGMNSRLDPLQAAVLSSKLPYLDGWNRRRRELADRYTGRLGGLGGLALPEVREWATPVWHVFPVRIKDGRRAAFASHLGARNIGTNVHYPVPIHRQACFSNMDWDREAYPVTDCLANEVISLPLDPLHTDAEIDVVIEAVLSFFFQK